MMSNMKEKLSAFIDGELDPQESAEMLRAMQQDDELRLAWARYFLVRDAINGAAMSAVAHDFASRVSQTVAVEPTVLAPKAIQSGKSSLSRATRIIGQLAIAASVAAIAIIGLRNIVPDQPDATSSRIAQSAGHGNFVRVGATRWDKSKADAENELNMYLAAHNRHSPAASMKGMMSYVHVVGYDARQ